MNHLGRILPSSALPSIQPNIPDILTTAQSKHPSPERSSRHSSGADSTPCIRISQHPPYVFAPKHPPSYTNLSPQSAYIRPLSAQSHMDPSTVHNSEMKKGSNLVPPPQPPMQSQDPAYLHPSLTRPIPISRYFSVSPSIRTDNCGKSQPATNGGEEREGPPHRRVNIIQIGPSFSSSSTVAAAAYVPQDSAKYTAKLST